MFELQQPFEPAVPIGPHVVVGLVPCLVLPHRLIVRPWDVFAKAVDDDHEIMRRSGLIRDLGCILAQDEKLRRLAWKE